jgi:hypothetical protein
MKFLPWILVLGLLAGAGVLYSTNQKQSAELAQARTDSEELQKLRGAAEENKGASTDSDEVAQLRKDKEELLRLRNEIRQLRDEKQQLAKQAQAQANQPPPQSAQQLQQLMTENQQLRAQSQQIQAIQQTNQSNACMNNLRQIEAAKAQWALENQRPQGSLVNPQDIAPYLPGKNVPACPSGGTYTLNPIGIPPICSIPGHAIPK